MSKAQGFIEGASRGGQSVTADWTPTSRGRIEGVEVVEIRSVPKRHDALTEIFRKDWLPQHAVERVFQVVLSPGAVSAWHAHRDTTDRLFVAAGAMTVALHDARETSPTFGLVNEMHLTIARPQLVVVPPGVWHGVVVTGSVPAILLNLNDRPYDYEQPDHWRLPAETSRIPYAFAGGCDAVA